MATAWPSRFFRLHSLPFGCFRRQRNADQLLTVVYEKASICEGGRAPYNVTATRVLAGLEQFGPTNRLEPFRHQPTQDELALIVPDEHPVFVLDEKGSAE